jgi:RNA 2',3'-cyclic 3'-phosphodiesterase
MRLFTAIDLPSSVLLRLERLLAALRPEANIHWSPLDNLHITLKFIGEWPEARVPELTQTLSSFAPREPLKVTLENLGWYPNERSPRVLWVGVHPDPALMSLAADVDAACEQLGIARESRQFSPHLTLARVRRPVPLGALKKTVENIQPFSLGTYEASQFVLYRSQPGSNSSIYTRLSEHALNGAAESASTV